MCTHTGSLPLRGMHHSFTLSVWLLEVPEVQESHPTGDFLSFRSHNVNSKCISICNQYSKGIIIFTFLDSAILFPANYLIKMYYGYM